VLGFLMLAFGMKFLSAIDQSYHLNIFSREVYLAIWFVIAVITGFYLLGKIKFSHDSDLPFISVPRMLLSMASFVFAIYIFTGILGNDLKAIGAMIPPKSSSDFSISGNVNASMVNESISTYCGPGKYDELFELPYGLTGYFNYEDGIRCAREMNKPVFIDFTGHSCSNCKQMEAKVWSDPNVLKVLRDEYVVISLYTDDKTKLPEDEWVTAKDGKILKTIGEVNVNFEIDNYKTFATPWYILADSDGKLLTRPMGKEMNIENFLAFLNSGIEKFSNTSINH
jgi:thiol:disulfide interchange protein DsbD